LPGRGNAGEVAANCGLFKFTGRRRRDTQVTDVHGIDIERTSNQASEQTSKQVSERASKQASNKASEHASEQASGRASKQQIKQRAGELASKQANEHASAWWFKVKGVGRKEKQEIRTHSQGCLLQRFARSASLARSLIGMYVVSFSKSPNLSMHPF